jgi:hypothetical protein
VSEAGEEWISASTAKSMGPRGTNFTEAILQRAGVGLVRAKAFLLVWDELTEGAKLNNCEIPKNFWKREVVTEDWDRGDFGIIEEVSPTSWMAGSIAADSHAYGVSFARADIEAMVSASTESEHSAPSDVASPAPVPRNQGGRPPKDWEAVMIELAGQLYDGDLKPDTQANIEDAIKNYFSSNDMTIGDSTARDHARPLYQRLARKDGN